MPPTISLDEEVRLYSTNSEREKYESLATLYGIIVALDYLERAYVRDSISATQCVDRLRSIILGLSKCSAILEGRYSPACTRLLSQYKTMMKLVADDVSSVESFMTAYKVDLYIQRFSLLAIERFYRWIIQQHYIV